MDVAEGVFKIVENFIGKMKGWFYMDLYNDVMTHDKIYSLMYSPERIDNMPLKDQIVEIETSRLKWSDDKTEFMFVWGWPGPDCNFYTEETYGKGWAFTKKEICKAWERDCDDRN